MLNVLRNREGDGVDGRLSTVHAAWRVALLPGGADIVVFVDGILPDHIQGLVPVLLILILSFLLLLHNIIYGFLIQALEQFHL